MRADPLEVKEQYGRQRKDLQEGDGEATPTLRVRKKLQGLSDGDGKWIFAVQQGLVVERRRTLLAKPCR